MRLRAWLPSAVSLAARGVRCANSLRPDLVNELSASSLGLFLENHGLYDCGQRVDKSPQILVALDETRSDFGCRVIPARVDCVRRRVSRAFSREPGRRWAH